MSHLTALLGCLILSFLTTCGNHGTLNVIQSPPSMTVKEGESVHMLCCWGTDQSAQRVRVKWNTSNGVIINDFREKENETYRNGSKYMYSVSGNCSELNISKVSTNDTGIYICKVSVEIPILQQTEGNGTQLTVQSAVDSSSTEPLMSIPVTVVLILLLLATGGLCLCAVLWHRIKKKLMPYPGQASGRVGMVIHEEPHEDVEELEERREKAVAADETSSSSSRGSTEWRAVQVYESFDYFAVQNSKDG